MHSVSAAELKAEAMIKLPIVLETEPDWQKVIAYAIDKRNQLQILADQEQLAAKPDRDIGDLWEELSGGKCLFVMVKEKRWDWIEAKLRSV